jgi:hypothetical protein
MKDSKSKFSGTEDSNEWVESLTDFNREDLDAFDNLVERSIQLSKRLLSKTENEDFFRDLVMNFY